LQSIAPRIAKVKHGLKMAIPSCAPKTSKKVEVRACKDKGMGVFALKDFVVGEEIHCEKPLVLFSKQSELGPRGVEDMIAVKKRKLLWSFHDAFPEESSSPSDNEKSAIGITRSNSLPARDKHGLLLLACGLNYACNGAENARYVWREDLKKMMVRAIRPIAKGDEVLVCYIDMYLCREERQKRLWNGFRFKCACSECTTKWSESRDQKLEAIRQLISMEEGYIPVAEREPKTALGLAE
jgi:SET domain-containing protein